ncbi:MAG: hypothetical protein WCL11_28455, partial [Verrucomicrobiota bacterium]
DPTLNSRAPRVRRKILSDRIQLYRVGPTSVFVEFRLQPSSFTVTPWDGSKAYAIGDSIYRATTGECYQASQESTGNAPEESSAYWDLIPMPAVLADYVQAAAYAEALKVDGENDKAIIEKQAADGDLDDAMATDSEQTGQQAGFTMNRS